MTKKSEVLLWFVMEVNIGSRTMVNTPLAAIPYYPNPWQTPQDISSMLVITFQGLTRGILEECFGGVLLQLMGNLAGMNAKIFEDQRDLW